jgi:hypothetical protein
LISFSRLYSTAVEHQGPMETSREQCLLSTLAASV